MNKKTEAKCNGLMLTVGFHAANPPLIWRFDLERNHSFTLALQGEPGDWELGVTSPKGDFSSVVHFTNREDAEEAFTKVEKILSHKRGSSSLVMKALAILGVSALLIVAGVILFGLSINHQGQSLSTSMGSINMPSVVKEGVPLSADDVLKAPH